MRIVATWLSGKPSSGAWFIAAWSVIILCLGSLAYWRNLFSASLWMSASFDKVFHSHEYWRLWTTLFAHGDLGHLLSNSTLFLIFGYFLSGYFGAIVFPLLAFFVGGLTNAVVLQFYPPQIYLIGVSGVVYWMGGVWLTLYLLLDLTRSVKQRLLRSLGVALAVFMPSTAFDPQVSYMAHFVGFIFGVISGVLIYWWKKEQFRSSLVFESELLPVDQEAIFFE